MLDRAESESTERWYPVLRAPEAEKHHIARVQLLGHEIAIWRDDAGRVNAWANQCPHRGVRLSIGLNLGDRLKCRYHGWEFETGTAQCVAIPAHPGLVPAKTYRAHPYGVVEKYGYVWVNLAGDLAAPAIAPLNDVSSLTLRSVSVRAASSRVVEHLLESDLFELLRAADAVTLEGCFRDVPVALLIMLQPAAEETTTIHSVAIEPPAGDPVHLQHECHHRFVELRAEIERGALP